MRQPFPEESKHEKRVRRAAKAQASVGAAVACPLCPNITPSMGLGILTKKQGADRRRIPVSAMAEAARLADDVWLKNLASWLEAYWTDHRHGPSWRVFWREAALWPDGCPDVVQRAMVVYLGRERLIDGLRTPFGMRTRTEAPDGRS